MRPNARAYLIYSVAKAMGVDPLVVMWDWPLEFVHKMQHCIWFEKGIPCRRRFSTGRSGDRIDLATIFNLPS